MQPGSSDYLTVSDLSHHPPQPTPLQLILKRIDSSVINRAYPGLYQQGTGRDLSHERNGLVFEQSLFAFQELIVKQLWKSSSSSPASNTLKRYESAADFCKRQWNIDTRRVNGLVECAALLQELSQFSVRPKTEAVCLALIRASDTLQPSPLQRTQLAPALWARLLEAWYAQQQQQQQASSAAAGGGGTGTAAAASTLLGVEYMSEEFIHDVLVKPHLVLRYQQQMEQKQKEQEHLKQQQLQQQQQQAEEQKQLLLQQQHLQQLHQQQQQQQQQLLQPSVPLAPSATITTTTTTLSQSTHSSNGGGSASNASSQNSTTSSRRHHHTFLPNTGLPPAGSVSTKVRTIRCEDVAELLEADPRLFHPPPEVIRRVHQFFHGAPPQLEPAGFEGSQLGSPISIPFPEILDAEGPWSIVHPTSGAQSGVESCFLHVPTLPSKRRFESDEEVVLLDDTRMARVMNERLWDEFSKGNVKEAITLVPLSSTWFYSNELADWPCVVMPAFKFEQANGRDASGKKYYEFHNYMVVYLGHDPLRQVQFVETFQDLGVSPLMVHNDGNNGDSSKGGSGGHRWIAGYRRLMRQSTLGHSANYLTSQNGSLSTSGPHPVTSSNSNSNVAAALPKLVFSLSSSITTAVGASSATTGATNLGSASDGSSNNSSAVYNEHDDTSWIDPRADDIYSALPPYKKPRLERFGRPSDAKAAWHHSKRRKMDAQTFSKLADQDIKETQFAKDDDGNMSE